MFSGEYMGLWLIGGLFALIGMVVSGVLKARFTKYSKIALRSGLTGKEVAEKMLMDHGIGDVKVVAGHGVLTDHYNPLTKTVSLSEAVYGSNSVAAAAVAAHECGHAVQHAHAYVWLGLRSKMVPVVSVSSQLLQWVILGGILLINIFPALLLFGIFLFGATTLFSLVTLPVEVDASKRALAWLGGSGITSVDQQDKAKDALKWAAYTYFIAALASVASLLYLIMIYLNRR
jgi:Zn-dependent membrane protease YugP